MSNSAFARNSFLQDLRRSRLRRHGTAQSPRNPAVPWTAIAVTDPHAVSTNTNTHRTKGPSLDTWALIAVVIAAHLAFGWYANHHHSDKAARPLKSEVNIELERPEPPKPKIEPPKPPPPPRPQRAAQVLPQIEQAVAEPSDQPAVSTEPPVAVAPIAAQPPPPAPPPPVTAPFGRAGYLNNPAPDYPPVASRLGWEGTVILRVRVLSTGKVSTVEIEKSSGHPPLDDAAASVVKKWSFSPSKRGDTPIDGWATVPIEFKLDQ